MPAEQIKRGSGVTCFDELEFVVSPDGQRKQMCLYSFDFFDQAFRQAHAFVEHLLQQQQTQAEIEQAIENIGFAILSDRRRMDIRDKNTAQRLGNPPPQLPHVDQIDQTVANEYILQYLMFAQIILFQKTSVRILPTSYFGDEDTSPDTPSNRYFFLDDENGRKIAGLFASLPDPTGRRRSDVHSGLIYLHEHHNPE